MEQGDTVLYFRDENDTKPESAIVTRQWSPKMVNVQVVLDGTNSGDPFTDDQQEIGLAWRTSVQVFYPGTGNDVPEGPRVEPRAP